MDACRSSFCFSSQTQPINAPTMRMQPRTVRMYVPVELAPPNVQKSVTVSLHSSYGKLSIMAPP
jgi:hypothetical protein